MENKENQAPEPIVLEGILQKASAENSGRIYPKESFDSAVKESESKVGFKYEEIEAVPAFNPFAKRTKAKIKSKDHDKRRKQKRKQQKASRKSNRKRK